MIAQSVGQQQDLSAAALAVRQLAVDAILKARSGHIGLPLGLAEAGSVLFGRILKHCPEHPDWADRDRFVLSAGHGSMLLYALLHLSGYGTSGGDLGEFRRLGSSTPGHPEYRVTPGVETTTGPLGQGFANAVGMAIAERRLAAEFNRSDVTLVNHRTYVLAGDGDLMEGVSYEAASIAGHLRLDKLTVFFDSNSITIDGSTDLSFSEDVPARFEAMGWQTIDADAYDEESILNAVGQAHGDHERPSLILLRSKIGLGLPRVEGTAAAHGGPLEDTDSLAVRGPDSGSRAFTVDPHAYAYFHPAAERGRAAYRRWVATADSLSSSNTELHGRWTRRRHAEVLSFPEETEAYATGDAVATRVAGGAVLQRLHELNSSLIGGSADLTVPCFGPSLDVRYMSADEPDGWLIPFGVREHAMGSISNGLALHGGVRPFCATFLAFSDYMRPAIRLAALMELPVIYVLTHDSIRIGEDGPTHQPVEHIASLRAIPGVTVIRPADAPETEAAWRWAAENTEGPTVLLLTRQVVPVFSRSDDQWRPEFQRGGYVVHEPSGDPELVIVATGSEVPDAIEAARMIQGRDVRVVSMPCREEFLRQSSAYRNSLIPPELPVLVVEAGSPIGWHELTRAPIDVVGMDRFGASGPGGDVAEHFGFTPGSIRDRARALLSS